MENKFYINILFKFKDEAKKLGALYDAGRSWYVKTKEVLETFEKVYLFILYKDKDKVKEMGCAWSKAEKKGGLQLLIKILLIYTKILKQLIILQVKLINSFSNSFCCNNI
jgi:hypothetical protein